mmetsp:Transcript_23627/g.31388  ORF Transcript_23627/g.31388 Transcript_23627/m.31388 type:complete len:135 (-) Transcript_23627:542-946(-)
MISKQSFYIKGIDDPETFKDSAFGAMGLFIATFVLSIVYLMYDSCCAYRFTPHDNMYDSVPSPGYGLPPGMTDYEVNMELPRSSGSSTVGYSDSPSPLETDVNDSINYSSAVSERMRRRPRKSPSFTTLGGELT